MSPPHYEWNIVSGELYIVLDSEFSFENAKLTLFNLKGEVLGFVESNNNATLIAQIGAYSAGRFYGVIQLDSRSYQIQFRK